MQNRPSPDLKSVVERDAVAWLEVEAERTRVHLANCHKQVAAFSAMMAAPGGEPLQAFVQNWTDLRDSAAPKLQHQEALLAIVRDRDEWREQHENLLSVRQSDLAVVATQKDRLDKLEEALEFYADEPRWRMSSNGVTPAMDDAGHRAREALARGVGQ